MHKPVGGFFELEPSSAHSGGLLHSNAFALSTGRACIGYILDSLKPVRCYVPSYTCDAVYEPFLERSIPLEYYPITAQFELQNDIMLNPGEYLFFINYFGVKHEYSEHLIQSFGDQLILDNTHSFFYSGYARNWSFTSARKYFGVPDGAFVFEPALERKQDQDRPSLPRFKHPDLSPNMLRTLGAFDEAYLAYQAYEKRLNADVLRISVVSEEMLKKVDYSAVICQRQANFQYYHKELGAHNQLKFENTAEQYAFCYPFLPKKSIEKTLLHQQMFFVPALWADVLNRPSGKTSVEEKLCLDLLPLPIDHRYTQQDLEPLVRFIKENLDVEEQ